MNALWTLVGILAFAVGLVVSIALHEVGHLVPAKRFGVRVTQYMVGFGRTVWSVRRGETEYGIKAIPLGGYIRMVGMFPPGRGPSTDAERARASAELVRLKGELAELRARRPAPEERAGVEQSIASTSRQVRQLDRQLGARSGSTGVFSTLVADARRSAQEELRPGDEDRVFYRKPVWQKLVIMSGGPLMNVLLAVVLAGLVLTTYGIAVLTPTVSSVSQCVVPAGRDDQECRAGDPRAPAAAAGFRPGDVITSVAGTPVASWEEASALIRQAGAGPVDVGVRRDGAELVLRPVLVETPRPSDPLDPRSELVPVGFLGVGPTAVRERQDPAAAVAWVGDFTLRTAQALAAFPARLGGVWDAAFGGAEREVDGPVGIVGAGRIGGEIASADAFEGARVPTFLLLLASFNMAIALFNLVPLLPLDGGHIAGALWEGLRRWLARVRGRPDPGHVDVARALPLAYAVAVLLIGVGALLLYADIVNPVRLTG